MTSLVTGQRVRVVNYDIGRDSEEDRLWDGELGTVAESDHNGYVRVEMDNPDPELAEYTMKYFGTTGMLFVPRELEAVDE